MEPRTGTSTGSATGTTPGAGVGGDGLVPEARRIFVGYLGAQAVLGVAWWVLLASSPTVRGWFELMPGHPEVMDAWVFADVGVVVVGSAVAAVGLAGARAWTPAVLWFTAGAIVYPSIFLFGWVAFTSEGGLLLGAMVVVSSLTTWIAWQVWRARRRADLGGIGAPPGR